MGKLQAPLISPSPRAGWQSYHSGGFCNLHPEYQMASVYSKKGHLNDSRQASEYEKRRPWSGSHLIYSPGPEVCWSRLNLHSPSSIPLIFQMASPRPLQSKVSSTLLWQTLNYCVLPQTHPWLCLLWASVNGGLLPLDTAYPTAEGAVKTLPSANQRGELKNGEPCSIWLQLPLQASSAEPIPQTHRKS